jgi:hypothetical protein
VSASWQRLLAVVGMVWALVAAGSAVRATLALPPDPMARLEAEFRALAASLPASGEVGYLEQWDGAGSVEAVRMHYAAQYALAPRVVVGRTGPPFVIVAAGTERPGGDPRLNGYFQVAQTAAGHRVFRRPTS